MAVTQFDKDFGYLMPFLDKVAAAAPSLRDPASREELTRLIAEEKQRWARVRQLLSGAQAADSKSDGMSAENSADSERERPAFTVGKLR